MKSHWLALGMGLLAGAVAAFFRAGAMGGQTPIAHGGPITGAPNRPFQPFGNKRGG